MASQRKNMKKSKASIRRTNRNKMLDNYKKNKISKNLGKLDNQHIKPPSLNAINAQKSGTVYNVMSDMDNSSGGNCHCQSNNKCHYDCSNSGGYCTDDSMCFWNPYDIDAGTRFEWWNRPRLNYYLPGHDGNGIGENFENVRLGATPVNAYHFCKSKGCDDWHSFEWRYTGWCQTGGVGPACCPQSHGPGVYKCHCHPDGASLAANMCTAGASPYSLGSPDPCPDSMCPSGSTGTDFYQNCICGATNCDDYEFGNYPYADENYLTQDGLQECINSYGIHMQDNCMYSGEVMIEGDPAFCQPLYGNWFTLPDGSSSGLWISPKIAYHWTDTHNNCASCDLGQPGPNNRGYEHGNCRYSHHWRYCYYDPDPIPELGINDSYCNDTYYDAPVNPSIQNMGSGPEEIDYDTADGFCFRYDETSQLSVDERIIWKITCMGGDQCYHGRGLTYQDKDLRRGGLITPQPMKVGGKVKRTKKKSRGNGIEFSS